MRTPIVGVVLSGRRVPDDREIRMVRIAG